MKIQIPAKKTQRAVIVALCMFALTFAVAVVFQTVVPSAVSDDTRIYGWKFITGDSAQAIEGDVTEFKQATRNNPPRTSLSQRYMRLSYTVAASDNETYLELTTKFSTLRVLCNGEEIYNNGYTEAPYSGSRYSLVRLPASSYEQQIDIYLYAPFGFSLSARLQAAVNPVNYAEMTGLILGCAVVLIGIVMLVVTFAAGAKSNGIARMLLLSLTTVFCGILLGVTALSDHSTLFSASYWLNIRQALQMFVVLLTYAAVLSCHGVKNERNIVVSLLLFGMIILMIFISSALWMRILLGVFALFQILLVAVIVNVMSKPEYNRIKMNGFIRVLLFYVFAVNIYNCVSSAIGFFALTNAIFTLGISVFILSMFWVFVSVDVFAALRADERKRQIQEDSVWIDSVSDLISKTFVQNNEVDFFTVVAQGISFLAQDMERQDESEAIHSCAAIYEKDGYREIYNNGVVNCDYSKIEEQLAGQQGHVFIGSSYIDMIFLSENHPKAVVYIEGGSIRSNPSIGNIVRNAYDSILTAYANMHLKADMHLMQENLFIHMAQIVEQRFSGTGRHLLVVSKMVETLCRELGYDATESRMIASASLTHDIGKIAISESILTKQGTLTEEERTQMQEHIYYGRNILSASKGEFFDIAGQIAFEHHENYDGTGYLGKKGEDISVYARIVHVADVFDALLSPRSYKQAWDEPAALDYIEKQSGAMFDPKIVEAFRRCSGRMLQVKQILETGGSEHENPQAV